MDTVMPKDDASDPYAREEQMDPRLDADATARVAGYGHAEALPENAMVFERGQRSVDFFLVLEGSIDTIDLDAHGHAHVLNTHGPGQFTGEIDLFNDHEVLVSGRAGAGTRAIRVHRPDFHRLMTGEPDIGEIVMRAFILRRTGFIAHGQAGVALVGPAHGADTARLQRFLTRNNYPHRMLDTETDAGAGGFLACFDLRADELPVVIAPGEKIHRNPSDAELADALGLTEAIDPAHAFDVAIVGAGPAGLAAAVYGASEGLDTIVLESFAPGGQAGTSSKIENYLGFPTGISGQALAGRAQVQAQKFGARLAVSRAVVRLECGASPYRLTLDDGQSVQARVVVVAAGARYRKLDVPGYERFEGGGIHYAATAVEAQLCDGEGVVVVGGGNSAGQAAMFLTRHTAHVHMLVRGPSLAATMSDYLVQRIANSPHVTLLTRTEITGLEGEARLERVTWTNRDTGAQDTKAIGNVFAMIGAVPNTGWLGGCLALDGKGFVVTGRDKDGMALPSPFATSLPGVFAVGDVRAGSVKRVASGVGEGSVVIAAVHQALNPGVG